MKQHYTLETIKEIVSVLKLKCGNGKSYFTNVKPIHEANSESLVWVSPQKLNKEEIIKTSMSNFIICDISVDFSLVPKDKNYILVENPRLAFLRIVKALFIETKIVHIHNTAVINPQANIGANVSIGPNTYIGKCIIRDNTEIHGNCYIYDNVVIGENVTIQANTTIGSEGFGYQKNEQNQWEKFPHIGGVIIEDFVEIGANNTIDRGTIGDTIIRKFVKIDNLIHIAHNVEIGENSMIIANSMIGGSTKIGANTWIAPSSSLRDGLMIGNNVIVGMGAIVTKNIPDNETWVGNPARKLR
ncbi:MAG: UDP-3-O-(3-hydroxymyristoyl)glucosamine N-acyltransferase [Saprospiraceae bacterium]|jgi:UDP-3-O-[3-hydroxymyristoyl] glucosamine N-acyltransferase|nr:UDP-3-O-(3-hydroxymyristoyl)glucosamine N-acyltransferase [Saprospiraceae bacterium]